MPRKRNRSRWLLGLLTAVAALVLAACGHAPQSELTPAGPVARTELQLIGLGFWIMVGIGGVVFILLFLIILRFRVRKGDEELPAQIEGNNRLEFTWTLIPLVLLAILAVPTVKDMFTVSAAPAHANALPVKVVAHQWWWEFDYPSLHIVTATEMHIPAGRPIDLSIESADVIHAFWVPELAGKTDAIPGRVNKMWLEASKPGDYSGQCAAFCGTDHALMRFQVIADTTGGFNTWVHEMQHPNVTPRSAAAKAGQKVFATEGCSGCHTIDGTPYKGTLGPNLTNLGLRTTIASAIMANNDANLVRWITNPQALMPGNDMPKLNLTPTQIHDVSAYLEGMK